MIDVNVSALFLDECSIPEDSIYIWGYNINIINSFDYAVKLVRKKLEVVDSIGQKQIIDGSGAIFNDFVIQGSSAFEVPGGILLASPSGVMNGVLFFLDENDQEFEVQLPPFSLDSDYDVHCVQ